MPPVGHVLAKVLYLELAPATRYLGWQNERLCHLHWGHPLMKNDND